MSKVIGTPLSQAEYKELLRLITMGADAIRTRKLPDKAKCFLYESQFRCLQLHDKAPDVVRLEMKKARDTIREAKNR